MCNYIFQNLIILIVVFIFGFFSMRKKNLRFKPDKTKGNIYNGIESWSNTQGWILLIFIPIFVLVSLVEKWAPFTIILNSFGMGFCEQNISKLISWMFLCYDNKLNMILLKYFINLLIAISLYFLFQIIGSFIEFFIFGSGNVNDGYFLMIPVLMLIISVLSLFFLLKKVEFFPKNYLYSSFIVILYMVIFVYQYF